MGETENGIEFPEFLYRYRSCANCYFEVELEKAVTSSKLYLSSALDLNDPFEFRPIYKASPLRDVLSDLKATHGRKPVIARDRFEKLSKKIYSRGEYRRLSRKLKPSVQTANVEEKIAAKTFKELPKKSRVACFSEDGNNIPMWAHYADNHAGACVKYRINLEKRGFSSFVPLRVGYQTKRPVITTNDLRIFTSRSTQDGGTEEIQQTVFDAMFLTKSTHWGYEREWRVFDSSDLSAGYEEVPCLEVCEIAFGVRADPIIFNRTREKFKGMINVFRCRVSESDFLIDRVANQQDVQC